METITGVAPDLLTTGINSEKYGSSKITWKSFNQTCQWLIQDFPEGRGRPLPSRLGSLCFSHSVHRGVGYLWSLRGGKYLWSHAPSRGRASPEGPPTTPPHQGQRTVSKRAVRILLECYLVWQTFRRNLHENERSRTNRGWASQQPPWGSPLPALFLLISFHVDNSALIMSYLIIDKKFWSEILALFL